LGRVSADREREEDMLLCNSVIKNQTDKPSLFVSAISIAIPVSVSVVTAPFSVAAGLGKPVVAIVAFTFLVSGNKQKLIKIWKLV
jgi:hypothetical protein